MRFWLTLFLFLFLAIPAQALNIQRIVSTGGIEAWLIEDHTLPVIAMNFSFTGGNGYDAAGKDGTADFAARLLTEGAGKYNAEAFQDRLTYLASSIRFSADSDYFSGSLQTLSKNSAESFDLLRLALTSPRLDKQAIARVRAQIVTALRSAENNPEYRAEKLWWETAYAGHLYGRFPSIESTEKISEKDLRAFLASAVARGNLIVGVAGDMNASQLAENLDRMFGALPEKPGALPANAPYVPPKAQTVWANMDQPQTTAYFGHVGIKRSDPGFYPAYVMNHILGGGGFTSKLMQKVREQNGLAYSVSTSMDLRRQTGTILGSVATARESFAESMRQIREIWANLAQTVTEEDVAKAKQFLIGSFPLRFETTPQIAAILTALQQDHLGIDFFDRRNSLVEAVTLQDVQRAAQSILNEDRLIFAIAGQEAP